MSERNGSDEWLTIAEAARRLGVAERTLRHAITRHGYTAQTRRATRQTPTGTRQSTLLPADLLPDIAHHFEKWEKPAENGIDQSAGKRHNTAKAAAETGTLAVSETTAVLLRAMERQDAEIVFLRQQVQDLTATVQEQAKALAEQSRLIAAAPMQDASESHDVGRTAHEGETGESGAGSEKFGLKKERRELMDWIFGRRRG